MASRWSAIIANRLLPKSDADPSQEHAAGRSSAWLGAIVAATIAALWLAGPFATELLRYERTAVIEGQWWRLATCHFAHLSAAHLLLNLLGLVLLALLFPRHYTGLEWLLIAVAAMVAIGAGFVLNEPQLVWYVGLSGVLHGCLAAGALAWWRDGTRTLAVTLAALLAGKLLLEQWRGASALAGDVPVIVDAHLYGALGGLFGAFIVAAHRRVRRA